MLFDKQTTETGVYAVPDFRDRNALAFDWQSNSFIMVDGNPKLVRGSEAVKEWINLAARTEQSKLPIYPSDFGGDCKSLIGKRMPKGYDLSEFKRKMMETAKYCEAVTGLSSFYTDGETISFTVTLSDDSKEVAEVGY